ncbi:MAG: alpha/beta hydrolase [Candidatus Rokubacteria bacterium]|nr:alpha/beta hydrolase [Candidatus Rokubacteria bacterium]
MSYLAAGDVWAETGPTTLLVHGAGMSARSWTNQLWGLGQVLRVLAIDLPGHGESDPIPEATVEGYADSARALLDALDTGPVFVAGHSLGGAVAQALAARHPEVVEGLLLLSTCAKLPGGDGSLGSLLWYLPGPLRKVFFFAMAKKILFAPGAPRQVVLLGMEEIRTCRPETILKDVAAARAMDLEEMVRGLRMPTLILCGSQDRLTPPALSERLNELIQGSRLQIVEGAGHMLPLEAAARVNQALLDFVGSVAQSQLGRLPWGGGLAQGSILRRLFAKVKVLLGWNEGRGDL